MKSYSWYLEDRAIEIVLIVIYYLPMGVNSRYTRDGIVGVFPVTFSPRKVVPENPMKVQVQRG